MVESRTFVPASGNPDAKIVFVGEQPGRQEVVRRTPFVGPAGKNLDECLQAAGILRSECYFTNVIKDLDAPIYDYIRISDRGQVVVSDRGKEYIRILAEELAALQANIIVTAGNIPLYALASRVGITKWRGSIISSTLLPGQKMMPIFHPATWTEEKLHKDSKSYLNKYLVIRDLHRVRAESAHPEIQLTNRRRRIAPSMAEALEFLAECEKLGKTITYDIETVPYTREISCIGFALSETDSICIPFVHANGDYFTVEQESQLILRIASILENPEIKKLGQYVIFDSHLLFRNFGIVCRNLHDTMIAQKILYPEFPVGLDFITSIYTDIPYYKKEGKIWITGDGTFEQGWNYNCNDTLSCEAAFPLQQSQLAAQGNEETYERQRALIEPLTFMMEHGIKVDMHGMSSRFAANQERILELTEQCHKLMGAEINLSSPQQLMDYFYGKKKINPYLKDGEPTTNIDALRRLSGQHGLREASLILEIRHLRKLNSTFLDENKIDPDGRIRCSYNPVGTKFGRISSGKNIFGTGTNLQNLPLEVREFLIADDGYVVYGLDYSQFENRIVAYYGNIQPLIAAFEQGLDTHRLTATLVSAHIGNPCHYDDVTDEMRQELGKRPNHAFNYGYGPRAFALAHEIDHRSAKLIYDAYHKAYTGIRHGYWKCIEESLRASRSLTNLYGRKVQFLGNWDHNLLLAAYSCIPQSTCGDCLNERGIIFTYNNIPEAEILTQVHDSMDLQLPLELGPKRHAEILIAIKISMEQPLEVHGVDFIPPVDLVVGKNLNKKKGVEIKGKNFSEDVEILAAKLQDAWAQIFTGGEKGCI